MKENFDVFKVHKQIIDDYSDYVQSFLTIADEGTKRFVKDKVIEDRSLWPDALIQLNPAYEKIMTAAALAQEGSLHPTRAEIFRNREGDSFHFYRHQI